MAAVVPAQAGTQRRSTAVVAAKAGIRRRWSLAVCALVLAGCARLGMPTYWPIIPPDLPPPRVVSDSANGSTVDIARTQMIRVRLAADQDSPNRWTYELGKDRVLYPADITPRFVEPNEQEFTFRAEGEGTTSVRFTYHDPAQPQTPSSKSIAFDVVAR